jgi:predicted amidohydrolase
MKINIAVVQFKINQFLPETNLKKAEIFIKKAADQNAKIIVFPEDFITGPTMGNDEFVDHKRLFVAYFQKLAKKYKIDIVPGSIIEKENTGIYNVTYYIDSKGKIKSRYKKINLWLPERKYLTPGNQISVFNTKYGKIGLIICWDLIFPEIFRKMVKKGANIIICPSHWSAGDAGKGIKEDANAEIKSVDSICVARAFENEIIFVFCNAAGEFKYNKIKDSLIGHSQITIPFKGAIKKLSHNKEEMFIQEIDTNILKIAETAYKIRKDLKNRIL